MALDPEDPRWELAADDPLGGTAWYRGLPAATRARLGCELVASKMKTGLVFESVLKRGLLEFASTLPNGTPEFRYAYHEIIEEAQRRELRSGRELHPLLERIMRIHVTEEARHLSFARHYLKHTVPGLPRRHRVRLAVAAPLILGTMAQMMLKPSRQLVTRYQIPRAVIAEAYTRNPGHRAETAASLSKVRKLCAELRLTLPPYRALWQLLRLEAGASG